jgi:hypothetical protein
MYTGPEKSLCYQLCRTLLIVILYFTFLMQLIDFYYQVIKSPEVNNTFNGIDSTRKLLISSFVVNVLLRLIGLIVITVEHIYYTLVYSFVVLIEIIIHYFVFTLDFYFIVNTVITIGSFLMTALIYFDQKPKRRIGFIY